ncbi:Crp/Fnr family transcriptional regulator [Kibdelosporangium persicum]|uniref:cAMP-binding protein n=1 Tax=Kibdelosporangium persicum TaxID=2698649 RepID=A0ABX2FIK4_9PSEU|nr:Crp/Fnr family transcriptional regulator [Kibdelosporangium persicum]NRN70591.1 cAMP-binding protein [Kibdelosporangium persicum]
MAGNPDIPNVQARLRAAGTRLTWSSGEKLFREAEAAATVLLITRGHVKVTVTAPCGKSVILAIRGPGDLLGESAAIDGHGRSATVTALSDGEAVSVSRAEFARLVGRTPEVAADLIHILISRLRESDQRRLESGVYDVRTRTACWLLDAATYGERSGTGPGYAVHLTQTDIAEAVGASRVSVAKALHEFRDKKIIDIHRAVCRVIDPDRLRSIAQPANHHSC